MFTEFIINFFKAHSTFSTIFFVLAFLSGTLRSILFGLTIPVAVSGIISLFITIFVALMEKNNMGFTYNYIIDLEKVFYWTNDIVFIVFIILVFFLSFKKDKPNKETKKKNRKK